MSEFTVLGKSVPRKDAVEKVKGEIKYVADMQLPHMLHARFLRSPYAHARIKNIDTSKAEALPGVKCILTHQNVPKLHPMRKFEFLLDDTVHHPGEEVAAVAAITDEIAEEALKLIEVEYEVLPAVADPDEAIKPGAPLAHQEYGTNIYHGTELIDLPRLDKDGWLRLECGDIDKGFAEADYIVEGNYKTPIQYNCSPMPRSVLCEWTGDKLTCWADTQLPLPLLMDLSFNLGIPQSSIRLIANSSVGCYGGKSPEKTATLVAIMAKRAGRPVKTVFTRTEDFIGTHHRIDYNNHNKIGVKKDGTITAMHSKIIAHFGSDTVVPYVCQAGAIVGPCSMLYRWQNSKAETCGVLTNVLGYGAMNGFGDPEALYGIERIIDEAAEAINMDPLEFRLKNCMRYGDKAMEYDSVVTGPIKWDILGTDMDSLPEMIERCADAAKWKEKWQGWRVPMSIDGNKRRGIGVAIGMHITAYWPCSAIVKMNQDGSVVVLSGAVEIGQGFGTIIAQLVSEVLGIPYDRVNVTLSDTGATPAARGNVGNTGTSSAARAVQLAAEDVKRQLFELAAPKLGVAVDKLEARDDMIWVKGTQNAVPIAELCLANFQITGTANTPPPDSIRDEKTGKIVQSFAAACAIAEIEVDTKTGKVEILRITSGHDCGRAINPVIVENQIDLGLIMANGWVRTEEFLVDPKTAVIVNPNLLDYKMITFLDTPIGRDNMRIVSERPCAWGPLGAKGFSETAMTSLGPAVFNAVYNATGVRIYDSFLSPDVVLKALEKASF